MKRYARSTIDVIFGPHMKQSVKFVDAGARVSDDYCHFDRSRELLWHPANELEGLPGAPDPLEAPNLPIPCTARELAAFMVDGVGAMLPSVYGGDWAHGPDEGMLADLGEDAAVPREALRSAYTAMRETELTVGALDGELQRKAQDLRARYDEANGVANRTEAVFDPAASPDERNARRERAKSANTDLLAETRAAEELAKAAWSQWRKAIVRHLLRFADEDQEYTAAWWEATLNASMWWRLKSVTPIEAAMLLCGLNPQDGDASGEGLATAGEPQAKDYKLMLRWFEDVANDEQMRTMKQWLKCATDQGLRHHSWVSQWIAALSLSDSDQDRLTEGAEVPALGVVPVQRSAAHDASVLAALQKLGFDPKQLPKASPGKPSDAKAAARRLLAQMSDEVFRKTWQRLRTAKQISDA